mgnify:CR=1 FL=1
MQCYIKMLTTVTKKVNGKRYKVSLKINLYYQIQNGVQVNNAFICKQISITYETFK